MHDEHYKQLFAFPRMVEDLLRGFVAGDWIDQFDFTTLQKLSAEYVSDERRTRRGDTVWRVRHRDAWLHVLVLLEFQSTDDPDMALRILEYTALLYRELGRNDALRPDRRRPAVLPVVLYNGATPWRAARDVGELIAPVGPSLAPYQPSQRYVVLDERHVRDHDVPEGNLITTVVALEQSGSAEDLKRVVEALQRRSWAPGERELQQAVHRMDTAGWRDGSHRTTDDPAARGHTGGPEDDAGRTCERVAQAMAPGRTRTKGLEQGIAPRDAKKGSNNNASSCAVWLPRDSATRPPSDWRRSWPASQTRTGSRRSATASCVATPGRSSSPVSPTSASAGNVPRET